MPKKASVATQLRLAKRGLKALQQENRNLVGEVAGLQATVDNLNDVHESQCERLHQVEVNMATQHAELVAALRDVQRLNQELGAEKLTNNLLLAKIGDLSTLAHKLELTLQREQGEREVSNARLGGRIEVLNRLAHQYHRELVDGKSAKQ